jgi:hypothetical protein
LHDYSLPTSDRVDLEPDIGSQVSHMPADVIQFPDGTYYRAWRRGRCVKVRNLRFAAFFVKLPASKASLKKVLGILKRNRITAAVVGVTIKVSDRSD